MAVRIRSLAVAGPLYVPLASGRSVRLAPGASSADLDDVEVGDNAKVDRLRDRGLIDVEEITEERSPDEPESAPAEEKKTSRRAAREEK